MHVQITGLATPVDDAIRAHVEEQVTSSLHRLRHRIRGARLKIEMGEAPDTSAEKRCTLELSLYPTGLIHVEGKGLDVYAAVTDSLIDGKRAVNRYFDRMRAPRRAAAQYLSA